MPKFRSAHAQATHAVSSKVALKKARHTHKQDRQIHSVGTARNYTQALKKFAQYLHDHRLGTLSNATSIEACQYLQDRALLVAQKTLDLDRQAIQVHLGEKLEVVKSQKETRLTTRSYTAAQINRIASAQTEINSLSTRIAYAAGLRAHELLTLQPISERKASTHREWNDERFYGRTGTQYTVVGKGGLIREVLIPGELATLLESKRLPAPRQVADRGVNYIQLYDIGGGQAWSQSFSAASKRELGFSNGAHGVRHSYAQERMEELQNSGMPYDTAKATVAQELGHFDKETTEAYLR